MGAIWHSISSYAAFLSEFVGCKAGITLTRPRLHELLSAMPGYEGTIMLPDDDMIRVRSEEVQATTGYLLHQVGNIEKPTCGMPYIDVFHFYKNDPEGLEALEKISEALILGLQKAINEAERTNAPSLNPNPIIASAYEIAGKKGVEVASNFLCSLNRSLQANPWSRVRLQKWKNTVDLEDLFKGESLEAMYGTFFDQRFVDFLSRNFDKIDSVNWRKFEGLAAEYFSRQGFHVELGPGRNDDGVDLRVWLAKPDNSAPPVILVQCKRQKQNVAKVVVKALWADIQNEDARSGLIVTTSKLSPGAEAVCNARAYPIEQAERETLRKWIHAMQTPGTGIFLGE